MWKSKAERLRESTAFVPRGKSPWEEKDGDGGAGQGQARASCETRSES